MMKSGVLYRTTSRNNFLLTKPMAKPKEGPFVTKTTAKPNGGPFVMKTMAKPKGGPFVTKMTAKPKGGPLCDGQTKRETLCDENDRTVHQLSLSSLHT